MKGIDVERTNEELAADSIRKIVKDLNKAIWDTIARHQLKIEVDVLEINSLSGPMPMVTAVVAKEL